MFKELRKGGQIKTLNEVDRKDGMDCGVIKSTGANMVE